MAWQQSADHQNKKQKHNILDKNKNNKQDGDTCNCSGHQAKEEENTMVGDAPANADIKRIRRSSAFIQSVDISNETDHGTPRGEQEDEPSPLKPRRLHVDSTSTTNGKRQLRSANTSPPPTTAAEEEEAEDQRKKKKN